MKKVETEKSHSSLYPLVCYPSLLPISRLPFQFLQLPCPPSLYPLVSYPTYSIIFRAFAYLCHPVSFYSRPFLFYIVPFLLFLALVHVYFPTSSTRHVLLFPCSSLFQSRPFLSRILSFFSIPSLCLLVPSFHTLSFLLLCFPVLCLFIFLPPVSYFSIPYLPVLSHLLLFLFVSSFPSSCYSSVLSCLILSLFRPHFFISTIVPPAPFPADSRHRSAPSPQPHATAAPPGR